MPEKNRAGTNREGDPPIKRLPELVINQIAAGEVVERPASVVKELLDNAIDAGATRITLQLDRGGVELVRVADNGAGTPEAQVPLMVAPHATSKLTKPEDLQGVLTLGFRGEALASIASVSRLTIRTRTREQRHAVELRVHGGENHQTRPAPGPVGTAVAVANLFFNTPARRKFLRTTQTEQGHCIDVVRNAGIAHPAVGFKVVCDGQLRLELPPEDSAKQRAVRILGEELEPELLEAHFDGQDDERGLAVWGLVGTPAIARPTAKHQRVFVNGRAVNDKTIQHALRDAYRGLVDPHRKPTAVLVLEMAPTAVDVNVHPAKNEVRFRDQAMVHTAVRRAVREALQKADLTLAEPVIPTPGAGGFARARAGQGRTQAFGAGAGGGAVNTALEDRLRGAGTRFDPELVRRAVRAAEGAVGQEHQQAAGAQHAMRETHRGTLPTPVAAQRVLQVHKSYLVTQDEEGVLIIDQHALHERVMFERLVQRVQEGRLESQRMLTPAVAETTPQRLERLESLSPVFTRLGIEADRVGPASVGVFAFPTLLFHKGVEPAAIVGELLERADDEGFAADEEEALREILDMMACKAAVKAGDAMAENELMELVAMREDVQRASRCPHGRPTTVRLTIGQLDKMFGRA